MLAETLLRLNVRLALVLGPEQRQEIGCTALRSDAEGYPAVPSLYVSISIISTSSSPIIQSQPSSARASAP